MDPQFQELATQITKDVTEAVNRHVTDVVAAAEGRLAAHVRTSLESAEGRLAAQAQVNVEAVKSEARLAAEGYASTLKSIEGRLDRIESNIATGFRDRDAVLKNHNDRIVVLENKGA